jgi:uncharacterized membrane-anchored protein
MTRARRNLWLGIAGVAAAQALVLGWMIWDRAHLLASGREVVLEVVPVDPRSLFRGDYVILGYDMSRIERPIGAPRPQRGDDIYVTLQKAEGGKWKVVGTSAQPPTATTADRVVIKGQVTYATDGSAQSPALTMARYGIESFFVPEGTGRELEALVREQKLSALIAVDGAGNAGIKGLMVDGERVYEEPLL